MCTHIIPSLGKFLENSEGLFFIQSLSFWCFAYNKFIKNFELNLTQPKLDQTKENCFLIRHILIVSEVLCYN